MPWRHEGRRVKFVKDIDLGDGVIRKGERGKVTFANREEQVFAVTLDTEHPSLEGDNSICVMPLELGDDVAPHLRVDRVGEAVAFVREHGAALVVGGMLVGMTAPAIVAASHSDQTITTERVVQYQQTTYRLTLEISPDGVALVKDIDIIQPDETPSEKGG